MELELISKWIWRVQQVEKGKATSGKEKIATNVFCQIFKLVKDIEGNSM